MATPLSPRAGARAAAGGWMPSKTPVSPRAGETKEESSKPNTNPQNIVSQGVVKPPAGVAIPFTTASPSTKKDPPSTVPSSSARPAPLPTASKPAAPTGTRTKIIELASRWLHVPAVAATRREDKYKYLQYRGLTLEEIDALFRSLFDEYEPISVTRVLTAVAVEPLYLSFKFAQPISSVQVDHTPSPFFAPFQKQIDDTIESKKNVMSLKDIGFVVDTVQEMIFKSSRVLFLYDPDVQFAVTRPILPLSESGVTSSGKTNIRPLLVELGRFYESLRFLINATKGVDGLTRFLSVQRFINFLKIRDRFPQEHIIPPLDVKLIWYLHLLKGSPAFSSKTFKSVVPDPSIDFYDVTFKTKQDDAKAYKAIITVNSKNYAKSEALWKEEYGNNYHQDFIVRREFLDIERDLFTMSLSKLSLNLDFIEEVFTTIGSALTIKDATPATLVDKITLDDVNNYNSLRKSSSSNYARQSAVIQTIAFAHLLSPSSFSESTEIELGNDGAIKSIYDIFEEGSVLLQVVKYLDDGDILDLQRTSTRAYVAISSPEIWKPRLLRLGNGLTADAIAEYANIEKQRKNIWKLLYFQSVGLIGAGLFRL